MFENFTDRARQVIVLGQEEARMLRHNYIGSEHLLLGLMREGDEVPAKALESLGISLEAVREQVGVIIGRGQQPPVGHIPFTPRAKRIFQLSGQEALQLGHKYVGPEHILLGLLIEGDGVGVQVLVRLGADLDRIRQQVIHLLRLYQSGELSASSPPPGFKPLPPSSRILDQFGRNLTQSAREVRLDPVIGREKEIQRVMQVLSRLTKNNPVLVGAHGVGKTAVVEALAQRIVSDQVLRSMGNKLVYRIDAETFGESSGSRDEVKAHLQAVVEEVRGRGDIILFLDGLRALSTALWTILNPMLSRGELQIIGALTPDEYRDLLHENAVLERAFVPIQVAEPTVGQTTEILERLRRRYEAHHRVSITDGALAAAAELASRQLPGKRLPGKAVDLIDEAASLGRIRRDGPPPILREYDEKIAQVSKDKESAIDSQDFAEAAALRDTEKQLLAKKAAHEREWRAVEDTLPEVNEELIAETLAIMLGLSSDGAADVGQPPAAQASRFAPAARTDDDQEIWAIS